MGCTPDARSFLSRQTCISGFASGCCGSNVNSQLVRCLVVLAVVLAVQGETSAQRLRRQFRGNEIARDMTDVELAELGDPLFELVLKDHVDEFNLSEIEHLLQPDAKRRQVFAVGERIIDRNAGDVHRAVVAFRGSHKGISLSPNVMLSVVFTGNVFPEEPNGQPVIPFIEGWGWDNDRGRYNYYRMDRSGGGLSWKFRGSSDDAAALLKRDSSTRTLSLDPVDIRGTCFQCHMNGAPIMKELLRPWNHWQSRDLKLPQFDRLQSANVRWPVATQPRFAGLSGEGGLTGAGLLDLAVQGTVKRFNRSKLNAAIRQAAGGGFAVTDADRLLRSLFVTTEFNMISSPVESNIHPLAPQPPTQPAQKIEIPASFLINSELIAGGGQSGFRGLGINEAIRFPGPGVAVVEPVEYRDLVIGNGLEIGGQSGDAHFSWLTPEPSNIDNQLVEELVRRGVVPGQFVAAVCAIDLRSPMLSGKRASLLKFVPKAFAVPANAPADPHNIDFFCGHALTKSVIQAIEGSNPASGSTAAEFLALLKTTNGNPREVLRQVIRQEAARLKADLSDPAKRQQTLECLFNELIKRRNEVINHDLLGSLDETGGRFLFPAGVTPVSNNCP